MKTFFLSISVGLLALLLAGTAVAKSADGTKADNGNHRYIVLLEDQPLAEWFAAQPAQPGESLQSDAATTTQKARPPIRKLDINSPASRDYLRHLDARFEEFRGEALLVLGRDLTTVHRYRAALNGFSARMTASEAARMAKLPGVKSVEKDRVYKLHTDAGPVWIGADKIWNGEGLIPARSGEGVVIGIIDSGINWEHDSFRDLGDGQQQGNGNYDHVNPYDSELGLCSDLVPCNDKLVGVYDFVEDDPDTEVVEENNNGRDNTNHGSLVASVAAGNPLGVQVEGSPLTLSGVAPNANLITYRVCYLGDPDDFSDDGCQGSAILAGIDQAVSDQVDVINYSIGSSAFSPWNSGSAIGFLNAFNSGIFVATSAGNGGPVDASIGNPANAPWISAVGSATHDRLFASILKATEGGDTTPPGDLFGTSFNTQGVSLTDIVHAKDFGNALCGTGTPELEASCDDNTGASNPFDPGTFDGQIVVCDRGTYGRVEKGKNLMLAGAGGYVLANTESEGESIVSDAHCLPSTHIGQKDGDVLREWLDSGSGHMGSITGLRVLYIDSVADRLSGFSSRGPNLPPVQDIRKPNLIAPGETILGASNSPDGFVFASGTSFSSPHIAGAAALLKSIDPGMTPSMMSSAIELTATAELARDENGNPATPHQRGAGRPRLGEAANAGLFLDETADNFFDADPAAGGDPKTLNLPSMTDASCTDSCSFTRTVKPLTGGRSWTTSVSGFPEGVEVSVSPQQFVLLNNSSQEITVDIDLTGASVVGQWVYGQVHLNANNLAEAVMPVVLFASAGNLPFEWNVSTDRDSGSQSFSLNGLSALPEVTYRAGGLVVPLNTTQSLVEDPTSDDPFDGGQGVFTVLHEVPEGALWLHTETLESVAVDLDLYVGLDSNGNGQADLSEQVCASTTPIDLELCDIFTPTAGTWWVLVQNWEDGVDGPGPAQDATLVSAVVGGEENPSLNATGPGIVGTGESFDVRVSWDNVNAVPGDELLGAVGLGSSMDTPNNVGVIPVVFDRNGISEPRTLALFNPTIHGFALGAGSSHDKIFIDVPPDVDKLTVTASGADGSQNNGLSIDLYRVDFDDAFADAPFAADLPQSATPEQSASGSGGNGPVAVVDGGSVAPGRWYAVVTNNGPSAVSVDIQAQLDHNGSQVPLHPGLWLSSSRPNISQGMEYNSGGASRAVLWYTYNEDETPAWYIASDLAPDGNVWTADILRFTNNGVRQQETVVGKMSMTMIGEQDSIFTFMLFGESGSDRMMPLSPLTCPDIDGSEKSYTGIWYRGVDGLGGASVLVNADAQAQIHYLFDNKGAPRWLIAANDDNQSPTDPEIAMLQFSGFCAVCEQGDPTFDTVGLVTREFTSETTGSWTLNYVLNPPLMGDVERSDSIVKITDTLDCE